MRLLVINWFDWTHPLWGGAEVYLREVYRRLAARGHEVTLLCSTYAGCAPESVEDGIRILRRGQFWTFHLQVPWYWRRELSKERWDCVFEYTNKVPMLTPLYVKAPLVAVAHHVWGRSIFQESKPPVAAYVWAMERLLPLCYRRTPWIAVSESTKAELAGLGIPAANVTVVANGVTPPRPLGPVPPLKRESERGVAPPFTQEGGEELDLLDGTSSERGPVVAWIGRMRRYKRVDVLLRAMPLLAERVPGVRLELAGDGPDAARLRALAGELGLGPERVRFLGSVSEAEKWALLGRAAVLAQPSAKEGWGRTVLEAGVCGVPAVASDVAGLRESVVDGVTGQLVRAGDQAALAGALAEVLLDGGRRERYGAAAREFARRFTWEAAADATEEVAGAASARKRARAAGLEAVLSPRA